AMRVLRRAGGRQIGPYLRGAVGGLAGRRTHASQHLLFGPADHRGLRVGSEAGALGFARRKRKARKQLEEAGTSHQRRLSIIWQRDRSADARNELAAFHSITSSASASSDGSVCRQAAEISDHCGRSPVFTSP